MRRCQRSLRAAVENLVLKVGAWGLVDSVGVRRAAVAVHAFNRAHRRKHALSLATGLGVSDALGDTTAFTLPFAVT